MHVNGNDMQFVNEILISFIENDLNISCKVLLKYRFCIQGISEMMVKTVRVDNICKCKEFSHKKSGSQSTYSIKKHRGFNKKTQQVRNSIIAVSFENLIIFKDFLL